MSKITEAPSLVRVLIVILLRLPVSGSKGTATSPLIGSYGDGTATRCTLRRFSQDDALGQFMPAVQSAADRISVIGGGSVDEHVLDEGGLVQDLFVGSRVRLHSSFALQRLSESVNRAACWQGKSSPFRVPPARRMQDPCETGWVLDPRLGDGASRPSSIRAILKPPVTETMIGRSGATYGS